MPDAGLDGAIIYPDDFDSFHPNLPADFAGFASPAAASNFARNRPQPKAAPQPQLPPGVPKNAKLPADFHSFVDPQLSIGEGLSLGFRTGLNKLDEAGTAISRGQPAYQPQTGYDEPLTWGDLLHPLSKALPKLGYGFAESSPELAGGLAGGAIGAATPIPGGGLAGAAFGAAAASAAKSIGPYYADELAKSPGDADGAYNRALARAGQSGAFTGASWAAFGLAPFSGAVKNILFQTFGMQPAISSAQRATENIEQGRPATEGLAENLPGTIVSTAVPMAGHALLGNVHGAAEPRPADAARQLPDNNETIPEPPPAQPQGRQPGEGATPSGQGQAPATVATTATESDRAAESAPDVETAILTNAGWSADEIALMSDKQRAQKVAEEIALNPDGVAEAQRQASQDAEAGAQNPASQDQSHAVTKSGAENVTPAPPAPEPTFPHPFRDDAISALKNLGFKPKDATAAVSIAEGKIGAQTGLHDLIQASLAETRPAPALSRMAPDESISGPASAAPEASEPQAPEPGGAASFASIEDDNQPDLSQLFADPTIGQRVRTALAGLKPGTTRFQELFTDIHAPAKALQEAAAQGRHIRPDLDIYKAKRLLPGRRAAAGQDFDTGYVQPLLKDAKSAGLSRQDIAQWLLAKHAPERNAAMDEVDPKNAGRGSGISNDEARGIISRLRGQRKSKALDALEPKVQAIRDYILDKWESSDLMHADEVQSLRGKYQHYVPLQGFEDPSLRPEEAQTLSRGGSLRVAGRETKQAFGRRSISEDPLANLIDMAHRATGRAEANRAAGVAWRFFKSLPEEARDAIGLTLDKGKDVKQIDPKTGMVRYVPEPGWQFKENAVPLKIGGRTHYMVFERKADAQRLARLSPEQLEGALRYAGKVMNFVKGLWTHWSPEFIVRHFLMRYPVEAMLNAGEGGLGAMGRSLRGFPGGPAMRAILRYDGLPMASRGATGDKWADYYHEMRQAGGLMDFSLHGDIEATKKRFNESLATLRNSPGRAALAKAKAVSAYLQHATSVMDNAQRLAAYVEARKNGKSPIDAAMAAREATVDFAKGGLKRNYLNLYFGFGQTAVTTAERMITAGIRSKALRRVIGGTIGAGFIATLYGYLAGGNDENGTPWIEKQGDWVTRLHMLVPTPAKDAHGRPYFFPMSLPYNYAFPFTIGASIASALMKAVGIGKKDYADIAANVGKSALEALTPVGREESWLAKFTPEMARPFVHIGMNEDFAGRPLHRQPEKWNEGIPAADQGKRYTGAAWKDVAQFAEKHLGLDAYPESYREIARWPLGSLMDIPSRAAQAGKDIAAGNTPDLTDIPLLHTMTAGGKQYDNADRSAFYQAKDQTQGALDRLKALQKAKDAAGAKQWLADHRTDINSAAIFRSANGKVGQLYKSIDAINASSLPQDEKAKRIDAIEQRQLAIMRQARGAYLRAQQPQPAAAR